MLKKTQVDPTIYEIIDPRETICADFSQGDIRFGQNAGKQCVAMSVTSSYNKIKSVNIWDTSLMNTILVNGDSL